MDIPAEIDLAQAARKLGLSTENVRRTVELLDDGNTVPFITRYRKDQTGALDEEQIRRICEKVGKMRMLAERKQTILKSIQSQGKLTESLAQEISAVDSPKQLEDLYFPFKPKKQTLATTARQRGLEPLAMEVLEAHATAQDLRARASEFIKAEDQLLNEEDVLLGVGHILAEWFSERPKVRGRLRKILHRSGKLICSRVEPATAKRELSEPPATSAAVVSAESGNAEPSENSHVAEEPVALPSGTATEDAGAATEASPPAAVDAADKSAVNEPSDSAPVGPPSIAPHAEEPNAETPAASNVESGPSPPAVDAPPDAKPHVPLGDPSPAQPNGAAKRNAPTASRPATQLTKKQKRRQKLEAAFKDYFEFEEAISRIPPHRILAINRGERAKILRVKMDADIEAMFNEAAKLLIAEDHPHAEFLRHAVRDALCRLLIPSLEREVRREMTERAEEHAVQVFAQNLRKLLLQPPVHGRRVLAVDPGFRSGCKLIALDEFGNVIGQDIIHVVGKSERIQEGRRKLAQMASELQLSVVAIGNGTACRETEQLVVDVMQNELKDHDIVFVIVNEAGASVYSTSPLGREELPGYDVVLRSAVSIGRRLLDPLSELVKINPANIGVGMYQHDVKAKHLRDSLDAVVESCVNYVGVDVNTASPALLRYVSGLNQLTARRLCEYRSEHGPFINREQFKQVPGIGDATFVQAAGFLKIAIGDNPLDATWIHPESYDLARRVLETLGCTVAEFASGVTPPAPSAVPVEQETAACPTSQGDEQPETQAAEVGREEPEVTGPTQEASPNDEPDEADQVVDTGQTSSASAVTAPPLESDSTTTEAPLAAKVNQVDVAQLACELGTSQLLLEDILGSLARPGRDPREDFPPPVFRRGIVKLEDLNPGMRLFGTVLNVVDFGAFVDIGLPDSGLIHISRLADRFVKDPHEVVGVGDVITVWVVDVDKSRRRVSLTAIEPGTERPPEQRQSRGRQRPAGRKPSGKRRTRSEAESATSSRGVPRPKHRARSRPPRKTKVVTPITKEMEEGKEPLRSFSDLMQFYEKKQTSEEDTES